MDKETYTRTLFDSIAADYDRLNRYLSLGLYNRWLKRLARAAKVRPGEKILDAACGTGVLTTMLARAAFPGGAVYGIDLSPRMLAVAAKRFESLSRRSASCVLQNGDMESLPYADNSFDAAVSAFALRNLSSPIRALAELARVTRPGGRVFIMDIHHPPAPEINWLLNKYMRQRVHRIQTERFAEDVAGGPPPYTWLLESLDELPPVQDLIGIMNSAGVNASGKAFTLGVCLLIGGTKR